MLYIWGSDETTADMFTVSGEMDWAICVPLKSIQTEGLCFYLSGRLSEGLSLVQQIELLKLHVRLIELIARNVDSYQRLALLEQQQARISHFFSPAVLEAIVAGEATTKLEPREGDITVLFCDMRGFSHKVEKSNDRLLELLERVSQALGVMTRGIMTHEGAIADFQGDAALAFWGWPSALDEGPLPACRAALDILREFDRIGKTSGHPLFGFRVGIGIAHGNAVAGRIGTAEQSKVGVFGDTVNTASRMEGMTKQFGAPILIDAPTAQLLREAKEVFPGRTRRLGRVRPKGKENALELYQLLPPADQHEITDEQIVQFESAIRQFSEGQWPSANKLLQRLRTTDGIGEMYLRYMDLHSNRPPNDWDGAIAVTSK
jgi:adenylate cyclase